MTLKIRNEDIWDSEPIDSYVVVPTSIGWKKNSESVMGVGLAKEAAERYFELPGLYGRWCKENGKKPYINDKILIICVPIKPLIVEAPHLSWKGKVDLTLIMLAYIKLQKLSKELENKTIKNIKCPILGLGSGGLKIHEAIQYTEQFDWPDNISFFEEK